MGQPSQGAERIGGRVEEELGPLGASGVGEGACLHAAAIEQIGESAQLIGTRGPRLERPDPRRPQRVNVDHPRARQVQPIVEVRVPFVDKFVAEAAFTIGGR